MNFIYSINFIDSHKACKHEEKLRQKAERKSFCMFKALKMWHEKGD